jgi:hypothetical protein
MNKIDENLANIMKAEAPIWKGKGTNRKRGPTSSQENITQKRKHTNKG